jgi:hypothetical protein
MRGVKHATPEHPDSRSAHVEEIDIGEPPRVPARREELEAWRGQLEKSRDRRLGCQRAREHRRRRNFRQAEELAEEASLGQKLMSLTYVSSACCTSRTRARGIAWSGIPSNV